MTDNSCSLLDDAFGMANQAVSGPVNTVNRVASGTVNTTDNLNFYLKFEFWHFNV